MQRGGALALIGEATSLTLGDAVIGMRRQRLDAGTCQRRALRSFGPCQAPGRGTMLVPPAAGATAA